MNARHRSHSLRTPKSVHRQHQNPLHPNQHPNQQPQPKNPQQQKDVAGFEPACCLSNSVLQTDSFDHSDNRAILSKLPMFFAIISYVVNITSSFFNCNFFWKFSKLFYLFETSSNFLWIVWKISNIFSNNKKVTR